MAPAIYREMGCGNVPFSHGTLDIVKSRGSSRLGKIYAIHTHLVGNDRVLRVYSSLADIRS